MGAPGGPEGWEPSLSSPFSSSSSLGHEGGQQLSLEVMDLASGYILAKPTMGQRRTFSFCGRSLWWW